MLNFDRYHAVMAKASLTEHAKLPSGQLLAHAPATFYVTQRKMPFGPCVGHERLKKSLFTDHIDVPHSRFLQQDKADLSILAEKLATTSNPFEIKAVKPGTIVFAGEPFAEITGPFWITQLQEVKFEHAFDEPMTVAGRSMRMRLAAGDRHLSVFSLRRDGSPERSLEINKYAYVGGFEDTSFMEAAYQLGINAVGTMAHYYIQAFQEYVDNIKNCERDENGKRKHFQQTAFERWLDANPNGTTLLLDTISLKLGTYHAIKAAKSSEARRRALKFVRIDSGNLIKNSLWVRSMLDANGLNSVGIFLTSDLDDAKIGEVVRSCPFVSGFGVGTKLAAEVESVAGVIFKLCKIGFQSTMKLSETPGKETFPGRTQVWRCVDKDGFYVKDVITMDIETHHRDDSPLSAVPLLNPFFGKSYPNPRLPNIHEQRNFVAEQMKKFRDIQNYPVEISPSLQESIANLRQKVTNDETEKEGVIEVPFPA